MRFPPFNFSFRTHVRKRPFVVRAGADHTKGLICTVYYRSKPVFNLVMNKGYPIHRPKNCKHNWFNGHLQWT